MSNEKPRLSDWQEQYLTASNAYSIATFEKHIVPLLRREFTCLVVYRNPELEFDANRVMALPAGGSIALPYWFIKLSVRFENFLTTETAEINRVLLFSVVSVYLCSYSFTGLLPPSPRLWRTSSHSLAMTRPMLHSRESGNLWIPVCTGMQVGSYQFVLRILCCPYYFLTTEVAEINRVLLFSVVSVYLCSYNFLLDCFVTLAMTGRGHL